MTQAYNILSYMRTIIDFVFSKVNYVSHQFYSHVLFNARLSSVQVIFFVLSLLEEPAWYCKSLE